MNIQVIVAAHKDYRMPADSMYVPLMVGGKPLPGASWQSDAGGDSIASKNPYFCELTALYWAWKNVDADAVGLVHYRRHFATRRALFNKWEAVLSSQDAERLLAAAPVVLPKKRQYFIESIYSHYAHAHSENDLVALRQIISEKYPQYLDEFDKLKKRTSTHLFNMFIMRKDILNQYCSWVFDILFELEKRYSAQKRLFGFLSERLLDVWINVNKIIFTEIPVIFMEKENLIKKYYNFLLRKFS